ncbi:MAG: DUF2851 family protein [Bacteroidales bacterium]|nr:DUF2851 family protein [Bacteroidales bacterium]
MKEELLQYLWQHQIFQHNGLRTTDGREIHIISPGMMHHDAGPDFKQAVIRLDDIIWAGDVEIHVNGSDWYRHRHQQDEKYSSVILHVVYNADMEIIRKDKEFIPSLELKDYIPEKMLEEYRKLTLSPNKIPCGNSVADIPPLTMTSLLSALAVDRLIRRQGQLFRLLNKCSEDWNELIYRTLAINFGFKINSNAFELLAQSLPYKILQRHGDSRIQLYALIFGQAGLLESGPAEEQDEFFSQMRDEYAYLRYKYKLTPIPSGLWNLLRLRPINFPGIRLAQFSELLFGCSDLFNELILNENIGDIRSKLSDIQPHEYWRTHFQPGKPTKAHPVHLGRDSINLLIINSIAPLTFAFGTFSGQDQLNSRAVGMLEGCLAEDNHITRAFRAYSFPCNTALFSQSLLELYTSFCKKKKCYSCPVGQYVVTNLYGSRASPPA